MCASAGCTSVGDSLPAVRIRGIGGAIKCGFLAVLVRTLGELSIIPAHYSWLAAVVLLLAAFAFGYGYIKALIQAVDRLTT